jgi:hypothetical protein
MPSHTPALTARALQRARRVLSVAAIGVIAIPALVYAWGDAGHRIIGEAATLKLPPSMPAFFRSAPKRLAYLNPEPDRWKDRGERSLDPALDGGTSPNHFIDMELVPPAVLAAALKAPNRFAYIDTIEKAGVKTSTMGLLPFEILEGAQRLRVDFRNWRAAPDSIKPFIEQRIIDDAGILGHYVADGSNPAHTTIHFNGWKGANPNAFATDTRFHARFESIYVGSKIKLTDIMSAMDTTARVLPDLRAAIIAYLTESNAQVEPLYRVDKAHPYDSTTTAGENKAFAVERLTAGARMLRDIWWTAWVTSAR